MLRIGAEQEEVLVVSDQHGCPTSCADLAEGLMELVGTDHYGIHHIVGGGQCSWFDFATEIFDQAGLEIRVMSATTRDDGPQGAPPRLLGARATVATTRSCCSPGSMPCAAISTTGS